MFKHAFSLLLCVLLLFAGSAVAGDLVHFASAAIETTIRDALGKPDGILAAKDLLQLTALQYVGDHDTVSLSGLEQCRNLQSVMLLNTFVECYDPVFSLPSLAAFTGGGSASALDFSPLSGKTTLEQFFLYDSVAGVDLSPLLSHRHIKRLELHGVDTETFQMLMHSFRELEMIDITSVPPSHKGSLTSDDLSALTGLPLTTVKFSNSKGIRDLSALTALPRLNCLWLYNCDVEDISPLAWIKTLKGGILDLRRNPVTDLSPLKEIGLYKLYVTESEAYTLESLQALLPDTVIELSPDNIHMQ